MPGRNLSSGIAASPPHLYRDGNLTSLTPQGRRQRIRDYRYRQCRSVCL